jgi:hypothetical protein
MSLGGCTCAGVRGSDGSHRPGCPLAPFRTTRGKFEDMDLDDLVDVAPFDLDDLTVLAARCTEVFLSNEQGPDGERGVGVAVGSARNGEIVIGLKCPDGCTIIGSFATSTAEAVALNIASAFRRLALDAMGLADDE